MYPSPSRRCPPQVCQPFPFRSGPAPVPARLLCGPYRPTLALEEAPNWCTGASAVGAGGPLGEGGSASLDGGTEFGVGGDAAAEVGAAEAGAGAGAAAADGGGVSGVDGAADDDDEDDAAGDDGGTDQQSAYPHYGRPLWAGF